jgi:SPW repeat
MATNDIEIKDHSGQVKTASSTNAILGIWLVITPWVYGYVATARNTAWNSIVVGVLILIFGSLRYRSPHDRVGLSWANVAASQDGPAPRLLSCGALPRDSGSQNPS